MDGNITHARKTEIRCLKPRDDSQWENKETKPPISGHAASHLFHYYYYYYDKYLKAILFSLQKLHGAAVWIFVTAPHVTQFIGLCLQRTYLTREKKKRTYFYCPPLALTWAAWKELRPPTAWEQLTYWITGGKNHLYSVTL